MEPRERHYSRYGHNAISPSSWDIGFTEPRTLGGSVVERDEIQNSQKVLEGMVTMQDPGTSDKPMPSVARCFTSFHKQILCYQTIAEKEHLTMGY